MNGGIVLRDFEVASAVTFGGRQSLAAHRLSGGDRVVDVLGPETASIEFSGAFSGSDAVARSRSVDQMRSSGKRLPLSWDSFCYTVVISVFVASYENSRWIPYRVRCAVVDENVGGLLSPAEKQANDVLSSSMLASAALSLAALPGMPNLVPSLVLSEDGLSNTISVGATSSALQQAEAMIAANLTATERDLSAATEATNAISGELIDGILKCEQSLEQICRLVSARFSLAASQVD
jgi:hypothetical protein